MNKNKTRLFQLITFIKQYTEDLDSIIRKRIKIYILGRKKTYVFLKIIYVFIFREGKGGRKKRRETSRCRCLSCSPY